MEGPERYYVGGTPHVGVEHESRFRRALRKAPQSARLRWATAEAELHAKELWRLSADFASAGDFKSATETGERAVTVLRRAAYLCKLARRAALIEWMHDRRREDAGCTDGRARSAVTVMRQARPRKSRQRSSRRARRSQSKSGDSDCGGGSDSPPADADAWRWRHVWSESKRGRR